MHTHRHEDEYSVVLEGRVGAQIGAHVIEALPGAVLVKPRGVPHAFWNPADTPARLLEIISPAGFERYFAQLAQILATPAAPDRQALAGQYGLDLDLSSIPRLAAAAMMLGTCKSKAVGGSGVTVGFCQRRPC